MKLFGKVDIGAGVLNNATICNNCTENGWHNAGHGSVDIITRTADIRRPVKNAPLDMTNDNIDHVHPEDWATVQRCEDWIGNLPDESQNAKPFFLYCSVNIPHPPFHTNDTWLSKVNVDQIPKPNWRDPGLKDSIGDRSNHSNFSHQNSVKILIRIRSKFLSEFRKILTVLQKILKF